jgi:DNA (cytosine-5)-methyltransferase 1
VGYRLVPHYYRFEEYGVPQRRHRVIIVGIRDDVDAEFRVPAPTHIGRPRTARDALESPPIRTGTRNQELTRQSATVVARLNALRPGENAFAAGLPKELRLNIRGATISQIYRRLRPDQPAYTVTGSGGGGTHVYHWSEPRALTNRERARLQTFPDNFEFLGGKESVRRQIGMAVPPAGAQKIFVALFKSLLGLKYPSVAANLAAVANGQQLELDAQSRIAT